MAKIRFFETATSHFKYFDEILTLRSVYKGKLTLKSVLKAKLTLRSISKGNCRILHPLMLTDTTTQHGARLDSSDEHPTAAPVHPR